MKDKMIFSICFHLASKTIMKKSKAILRILTITTALLAYAQAHAQSSLTNGLVAYYPFNGNANDASGNGHNGTVKGAVLTTNRLGNSNAAYYFNGSAVINVPNSPDFVAYPAQGWTIAAWAYASTYLYPEHLVGKRQDGYPFWQLAIGPGGGLNGIPIGRSTMWSLRLKLTQRSIILMEFSAKPVEGTGQLQ